VTPRGVLYLHGFASSSASTKATYFSERFGQRRIAVRCPDLNQPDFATLTITRMLDRVDRELAAFDAGPIAVMGSSLGGTLAILAAARFPDRIDRLVLLAPAVMFAKPGHHLLSPARIEEWRQKGALPFFHYGARAEQPLNFSFYEDSLRYNAFDAGFPQPAMVFQGVHDASVDARTVTQFAEGRSNVSLTLLEDDHQLIASLPRMWADSAAFLGLAE
jgi:pimeloyl-ACP methyl ester carboxylesterase